MTTRGAVRKFHLHLDLPPWRCSGQTSQSLPDGADLPALSSSIGRSPYTTRRTSSIAPRSSVLISSSSRCAPAGLVDEVRRRVSLKRGAGQDRTDPVMSSRCSLLGGGGLNRRRSGLLDLVAQGRGVECNGERVAMRSSVRRSASCKSRFAPPQTDDQGPDLLVSVRQGQVHSRGLLGCPGRGDVVPIGVTAQRDPGQPQALRVCSSTPGRSSS